MLGNVLRGGVASNTSNVVQSNTVKLAKVSDFYEIGAVNAHDDNTYGIYLTSRRDEGELGYKVQSGKKLTSFKCKLSGVYLGGIGFISVAIKYKDGTSYDLAYIADGWMNDDQGQTLYGGGQYLAGSSSGTWGGVKQVFQNYPISFNIPIDKQSNIDYIYLHGGQAENYSLTNHYVKDIELTFE